MQAPTIQTAIPQRRYRLGEYEAVVLGEIESSDSVRYRYILALVRQGEPRPQCYLTCEKTPRARAAEGSHRLRVIASGMDEELDVSDRFADLDTFTREALGAAARILGITGAPALVA